MNFSQELIPSIKQFSGYNKSTHWEFVKNSEGSDLDCPERRSGLSSLTGSSDMFTVTLDVTNSSESMEISQEQLSSAFNIDVELPHEQNNSNAGTKPSNEGPKFSKQTRHSAPDWLETLQVNFKEEIILPCSAKTVSAVEINQSITSRKDHAEVKNEILNSVTRKLKQVFSIDDMPGKLHCSVL